MTELNEDTSLPEGIEEPVASPPKFQKSYHFDFSAFEAFVNRNSSNYFKGVVRDALVSQFSSVAEYVRDNPDATKPSCSDPAAVAAGAKCSLREEDKISIFQSKSGWLVEVTSGGCFFVGTIPFDVCPELDLQQIGA